MPHTRGESLQAALEHANSIHDLSPACEIIKAAADDGSASWARDQVPTLLHVAREVDDGDPESTTRAFAVLEAAACAVHVGDDQAWRAALVEESRATDSFVYAIKLAEVAAIGKDVRLAKTIYRRAEKLVHFGLCEPIVDDVEEEDNFHGEIVMSVVRMLGPCALAKQMLYAGVERIGCDGGDTDALLFSARLLGKREALELIDAIAEQFEETVADLTAWAYLARSTMRHTGSLRAAGKVVTRGRNVHRRWKPEKRDAVQEWANDMRAKLPKIKAAVRSA